MINNAINIKTLGLIVIDTINLFYRIKLEDDKEGAMRSFTRQVANLLIAAIENDFYVIVVEQVFTDKNGIIKTIRVSRKTGIRIHTKGGDCTTFYFDTLFIHGDTIVGQKTHFFPMPIQPISIGCFFNNSSYIF